MDAWQARGGGPVSFKPIIGRYLQVPCGQCIGCRLERSRQWAVRCMNESYCWDFNVFATLTYSDDSLPKYGSLVISDHQKFLKRLRDRLEYPAMKYYMCGEYGDRTGRPHYHYLLFGLDFSDKKFFRMTGAGHKLYTSELLDDIWGLGHCQLGSVSFDSSAYVARYIMKKQTGVRALSAYTDFDAVTGEVLAEITPEFNAMSRRSGIGKEFFTRFRSDIYPKDFLTVNGVKVRPPRYYDNAFEVDDPLGLAWIKEKRKRAALVHADNNTPERLAVREYIAEHRLSSLSRSME